MEESLGIIEINDIEFVEVKDLCYNYPDKKEVLKRMRVYYKDALMYILDELSSALDVNSEIKIFNQFFKRSKSNMGIFITHRVKITKQAVKIIVLNQGEVVVEGSH